MPHNIVLHTFILADAETCFDLSRSIDLHTASVKHTGESAIAGRTSGLIGPGEFVTWQAKHFGITQKLTSHITQYHRPLSFTDEQVKGAFKWFTHKHNFKAEGQGTVMEDVFTFEAPFGIAGWLFTKLVLVKYMRRLLITRNNCIKTAAETARNM